MKKRLISIIAALGPSGYPRTVNPFPEEFQNPPDWCTVARKLERIHP